MDSKSQPSLVVLAAGMGSRYGGLKQIDPMGPHGETILDFSVFDAMRAGFGKVVFVIRRQFESEFRQAIGTKFEHRLAVEYAFQELDDLPGGFGVPPGRNKPWGTAHAVYAARKAVREPFAMINADDFYGKESYATLAKFLSSNTGCCRIAMVGFRLANTLSEHGAVARGICQSDADGCLTGIREVLGIEKTPTGACFPDKEGNLVELTGDEITSLNMWGFPANIFDALEDRIVAFLRGHGAEETSECYIPTVVDELIRDGAEQVRVLPTTSSWFGVTFREDKPRVMRAIARLVEEGQYPERVWSDSP